MDVMEALALIIFLPIAFLALLVYLSLRFFRECEASEKERERREREAWIAGRRLAKCGDDVDSDGGEEIEYCSRCLEKMSIRCAFCGEPIFVGDAVGLYAPSGASNLPEFGEPYSLAPLEFIVCQRAGCAEKAKPVGIWVPAKSEKPAGRIKKYNFNQRGVKGG